MKIKCTIVLIGFALMAPFIYAQDFDADSVLYTPIPKTPETQSKKITPRKIFRDTVQNGKLISYFFNVQAGPLIGCKDCFNGKEVTFTTSTIHGITIGKKLRTGLGVGMDSYFRWHTMPLFGSVSWDLLGTKNTQALFVQFNYGWSYPWRKNSYDYSFTGIEGGPMINALAGYRITYHDVKIALAFGSKQQQVSSYFEYPSYYLTPDGIYVEGTPNRTTIKEEMRRFMISMSIGWK